MLEMHRVFMCFYYEAISLIDSCNIENSQIVLIEMAKSSKQVENSGFIGGLIKALFFLFITPW